jgi:diacylglycerol kinase (ATP)
LFARVAGRLCHIPVMPGLESSLLLVNANARAGDTDLDDVIARLEALGPVVAPRCPDAGSVQATIARHAPAVGRILVGGGDGTLNCALPAVLAAGLPLGVLPLGTANDFARSLGIPDLDSAVEAILAGHTRRVDVGLVNDRPFLNAVGLGVGADINRTLGKAAKSRFGVFGYLLQALRHTRGDRGMRVMLGCDGTDVTLRSMQVTIGNGIHYGGGMTIAEHARLDDGLLDVLSIRPLGLVRLLAHGPAMRSGEFEDKENIDTFTCRVVTVRTRRPIEVTADGEPVARTPVECRIRRGALTVFAPPAKMQT